MTPPAANSIYCPRCRYAVSWPAGLDSAGKAELAALARQSRAVATAHIRGQFDLSLADAKAVVTHISRDDDVCVRCRNIVTKCETPCATCKSANLNW